MSFSYRDRPRLSERLRGKSGDEILQELKDQLEQERKMFFDSNPTWSGSGTQPGFRRAGFPFDDDIMKRPTMRARLDELANRHPQFAEHLRSSNWPKEFGDISDGHYFRGPEWAQGVRNRHPSGGSSGVSSGFEDDPSGAETRSQASASSTASGSSAFSDGDGIPIPVFHEKRSSAPQSPQQSEKIEEHPPVHAQTKLPRRAPQSAGVNPPNVGDFGQAGEQANRNQRSMSAPPDNRVQNNEPRRYVSRIEINPVNPQTSQSDNNIPQQGSGSSSPGKPPVAPKHTPANSNTQQQQQQQSQQQSKQGNVRHIPIFVEGRDEPVIGRDFAGADSATAPPPPHPFGRPQFTQYHQYGQPQSRGPQAQQQFKRPNSSSPPPHAFQPKGQQKQQCPQQPHPTPQQSQQTTQQQQQQQECPQFKQPSKPPEPNDAIAKVEAIQKEVEDFMQQVENFSGSRTDKEYVYLDEMLTRNLIKLDNIDTEGKDNVRQARKQAIHSVQRCISILESKAQKENNIEEMSVDQNGASSCEKTEVPSEVKSEDEMKEETKLSDLPTDQGGENDKEERMEVEKSQSCASVNVEKCASEVKMEADAGSQCLPQEQSAEAKEQNTQCEESKPADGCEDKSVPEVAATESSETQKVDVDKGGDSSVQSN